MSLNKMTVNEKYTNFAKVHNIGEQERICDTCESKLCEIEKRLEALENVLLVYSFLETSKNSTKPKYAADQPQGPLKFIFNRRAIITSASIIIITILAGIIIVTTSTHSKQPIRKSNVLGDRDDSRKHIPINSTIESDSGYKFNGSLLIVSRDEWFAMAEVEGVEELKLPVPRVIIAHTASTLEYPVNAKIQNGRYSQQNHKRAVSSPTLEQIENDETQNSDNNVGGGMIVPIVPRDAWLAQPPSAVPIPLATPVERVIVLSTLTDACDTLAMCAYRVSMTQTLNIDSQKYDDIIYNFLIAGDGNVYEGRGWDVTGAHLPGHNSNSISLAYIGTFKRQKPSDKQMNVTKLLLEKGVRLGKLTPDYKIYGAYMLDPTSPDVKGDELYKSFKNWPHWTE